ncbi:hypothetical protein PLANPX_5796 [Lacipirellula parvula]|uniref:Uncharacterized protein n=1 Tax=Lacipirellula parvula TaxID=2650471 RepID=A0A5K7XH07_9BACT|nr:hypothetical protein PLANPX_5796 [Lacipirellula parvula]
MRQGNTGKEIEPRRHGGHDGERVNSPTSCLFLCASAPLREIFLGKAGLTQRRRGAKSIGQIMSFLGEPWRPGRFNSPAFRRVRRAVVVP